MSGRTRAGDEVISEERTVPDMKTSRESASQSQDSCNAIAARQSKTLERAGGREGSESEQSPPLMSRFLTCDVKRTCKAADTSEMRPPASTNNRAAAVAADGAMDESLRRRRNGAGNGVLLG